MKTAITILLLVILTANLIITYSQEIKESKPGESEQKLMNELTPKVTGIGGIFFLSKDPKTAMGWYGKTWGLQ